jgi:hypothetical protein
MAALPKLRVIKHAEGGAKDAKVYVHGAEVTFEENEGLADPGSNPSFVKFEFSGKAGARFRVEIRNASIVYREEVQLPASGRHEGTNRSFAW